MRYVDHQHHNDFKPSFFHFQIMQIMIPPGAGHVGRYLSLANSDSTSAAVCHIPSLIVFSFTFVYLTAFLYDFVSYSCMFLVLAFYVFGWATYLAVFSSIGIFKMRAAVATDWDKEWQNFKTKNPGCEEGMLHFVVLPNYAEEEEMLAQTVGFERTKGHLPVQRWNINCCIRPVCSRNGAQRDIFG